MKDLDIQVGDKVTYFNRECNKEICEIATTETIDRIEWFKHKILKIERPNYTVIEERKELLEDVEKEYLSNLIKPFKNKVKHICKVRAEDGKNEFIYLKIDGSPDIDLPRFQMGTMYKNMEQAVKYTLKELGLES